MSLSVSVSVSVSMSLFVFLSVCSLASFHLFLQYVAQVDSDDALYLSLLQTAPMTNLTQWCRLFNWHPLALDKCSLASSYAVPLAMRRSFRVS